MKESTRIIENRNRLVFEKRFTAERRWDEMEEFEIGFSLDDNELPLVGNSYIVLTIENEREGRTRLGFVPDNGVGIKGNMADIYTYHGWRGKTCGVSVTAHGLRECLNVNITGKKSKKIRVVFGNDLKHDSK